jgi:hypothetical protein
MAQTWVSKGNVELSMSHENVKLSDVQGTVTISGFFDLQWKDFNLAWPNSLGIDSLQISESSVWIPPLVNGNSIKNIK